MNTDFPIAPELEVTDWLNIQRPLNLSEMRGSVVAIHAFQMLCPGCVLHGIPQAASMYDYYKHKGVHVIGLHAVFEHHDVMTRDALEAFVHEYGIQFPIAIDRPSDSGPIPITMQKYQLRGTPSLVLIDQRGRIRLNHFGRLSDMQIGDAIGSLLASGDEVETSDHGHASKGEMAQGSCDAGGCAV